ncbi:hypothetical protein Z947_388 [Sulfitobacter geojensis]|nr:hypothetical protein Z947_388 [Sulfitobacter geojensis]
MFRRMTPAEPADCPAAPLCSHKISIAFAGLPPVKAGEETGRFAANSHTYRLFLKV